MIHSFAAKNFYCFKDKIEVSFGVDEKTSAHYSNKAFVQSEYKNKHLSTIIAVIGANASGKTNVLKALSFLGWIIVDSYNKVTPIAIQPFLLNGQNENTELWVCYSIDKSLYQYYVSLNEGNIIEEKLISDDNKITLGRTWNSEKNEYDIPSDNTTEIPDGYSTRRDASMIGMLSSFGRDEIKKHVDYWSKIVSNVSEVGFSDDIMINRNLHAVPWMNAFNTLSLYHQNTEMKESVVKILRHFDLDIKNVKIEKTTSLEEGGTLQYTIKAIHANQKELSFAYESSGTQQLFLRLLNKIVPVLHDGGILILDEIDTKIHPIIVEQLINLFKDSEINKHNAQIIFTTQTHSFLNNLDTSQILLVEKDKEKQSSIVYKLSDIEGVSDTEDYYANYLAGVYGATQNRDIITGI